jgi:hypothetical protein
MRLSSFVGLASILVSGMLAGCAADAAPGMATENVEVAHPINALRDVALDPRSGELSFSYGTSGGCASHTARTSVALTRTPGGVVAKVSVHDVSPRPDFCEAFLTIEGRADLKNLISAEARRAGIPVAGKQVAIDLPRALVSVRSAEEVKPAAGSFRSAVSELSTMALDADGTFSFSYRMGGGCAEHTGVASVDLVRSSEGLRAKLKVEDVADGEDFCEAIIGVEGSADVHALIATAAKKSGEEVEGRLVTVELPRPTLSL